MTVKTVQTRPAEFIVQQDGLLVLFIFPTRNVQLTLSATITSPRPVDFPFKVFILGDLLGEKLLLAQELLVYTRL